MIRATAMHGLHKTLQIQDKLSTYSRIPPEIEHYIQGTKHDFEHILELIE